MEGRDPLLRRDKGKRKRGWGSVGLYLDKRKTTDLDKDPMSNCQEFSKLGPAARIVHLGRRGAIPRLSGRSGVQSAVGESDPLPGVLWAEGRYPLKGVAHPGNWGGWSRTLKDIRV